MPDQYNRSLQNAQNSFAAVWDRLTPTLRGALRNQRAAFITNCHLWHLLDARPGTICVSAKEIAAALNADPRCVRRDLDRLREISLVDFHDRDRSSGTYVLYVSPPEQHGQPQRAVVDPQRQLVVEVTDDATPATSRSGSADIGAQGCPQRAEMPADIRAQACPRDPQRSLWDAENQANVDDGADACAQGSPRPAPMHGDIEHGDIVSIGWQQISKGAINPSGNKTSAAKSEFDVPVPDHGTKEWEVQRDLMAMAIDERLRDPECSPVNARRAAECVLDGYMERSKLWDLIDQLCEDFDAGNTLHNGKRLTRGAMFVGRMKLECPAFANFIAETAKRKRFQKHVPRRDH